MAAPSPLDAVPGTLYRHYRDVDTSTWRWQHFSPWELACKHCGELFLHVPTLDYLERYRRLIDAPARLNSTHRCPVHNARIGGAPASCHKRVAADISTRGRDRSAVMRAARAAGARGIGYYAGFLHTDLGRRRMWFGGQEARRIWQPILAGEPA